MANTKDTIIATPAWQAVAAGPGNATLTATFVGGEWAISESAADPGLNQGHVLEKDIDKSMTLAAGEYLHVRGRGMITLTADNEV